MKTNGLPLEDLFKIIFLTEKFSQKIQQQCENQNQIYIIPKKSQQYCKEIVSKTNNKQILLQFGGMSDRVNKKFNNFFLYQSQQLRKFNFNDERKLVVEIFNNYLSFNNLN